MDAAAKKRIEIAAATLTPNTWEHSLATALADVKAKLNASSDGKREPLFGVDAVDLLQEQFDGARWLVTNLITCGGTAIIGGEPKTTKTWAAIEICVAITTGTKAFGKFFAQRGTAIIFLAEDLKVQARNRIRALLAGADRRLAAGRLHIEPRGTFIDVLRDEDLAWIIASCRRVGAIDIIVLDPLRDIHSGEEDKSDSMRDVMRRLRVLGELLGCTVLAVHHTGKIGADTKGRRPGQRLRGSGAIHGAIDAGFYLADCSGNGTSTFSNAVMSEVKGARSAGAFVLDLVIEDDDQGEATSAAWTVVEKADADPEEADQLVSEIAGIMLAAEGFRATVRGLRKKPGGGKAEISAAIAAMQHEGLIEIVMRGKRHDGYRLTLVGQRFARGDAPQEDSRVQD